MPGGARFRYSVTPRLFRVVAAGHQYTAVHAEESEGSVLALHLFRYASGSFAEELGVLDLAAAGAETDRETLAATIGAIPSDPAGKVGDHSIHWSDRGQCFDPSGPSFYQLTDPVSTSRSPLLWGGDGWLYSLEYIGDLTTIRLKRVRADMTGDQYVSAAIDGFAEPFGMCHLTPEAYYCYQEDAILRFPRDGSAPSNTADPGLTTVPPAPFRCGLPYSTEDALFLLASGSEVRAWKFTGPTTKAALWPPGWATWADPNGAAAVLSHSLSPDGSEVAVYQANGGLLRVPTGAQVGQPPAAVAVEAHEGMTPDFMLARD